jgi:hypothetical protein
MSASVPVNNTPVAPTGRVGVYRVEDIIRFGLTTSDHCKGSANNQTQVASMIKAQPEFMPSIIATTSPRHNTMSQNQSSNSDAENRNHRHTARKKRNRHRSNPVGTVIWTIACLV